VKPVAHKKPTPAKKVQPRPSFAKKPKYDDISSDEEDVKPVVKGKGKAKAPAKRSSKAIIDDVSSFFVNVDTFLKKNFAADRRHFRFFVV